MFNEWSASAPSALIGNCQTEFSLKKKTKNSTMTTFIIQSKNQSLNNLNKIFLILRKKGDAIPLVLRNNRSSDSVLLSACSPKTFSLKSAPADCPLIYFQGVIWNPRNKENVLVWIADFVYSIYIVIIVRIFPKI